MQKTIKFTTEFVETPFNGQTLRFNGKKISHQTTRFDTLCEDIKPKWTELDVFYRADSADFFLIVTTKTENGQDNSRSFICESIEKLKYCLKHPVYKTMSFTAQRAYLETKKACIDMGLIEPSDFDFSEEP
jgi:hypothetical protein